MIETLALAGFGLASFAGVLSLTWTALRDRSARGEAEKRAAVLDANHTVLAKQNAELAAILKDTQERLNAMESMVLDAAASAPVSGAYVRLLSLIKAARAPAGGDGDGEVHHDEAADTPAARDLFERRD